MSSFNIQYVQLKFSMNQYLNFLDIKEYAGSMMSVTMIVYSHFAL